jgi:UDP-N-acetylglucosamine acyltransferase
MLGAMSKIVQDVPPYVIADGNPAVARSINKVGLERNGFSVAQLESVKQLFRVVFRAGYNRTQALEKLREHALSDTPEFKHFLEFAAASERGFISSK